MSLDIYFYGPSTDREETCAHCGSTYKKVEQEELFSCNITHNLSTMALNAALYYPLWRPETLGVKTAKQLAPHVSEGIGKLEADPERFKTFNPENGWGTCEGLLKASRAVLEACQQFPDARIEVSR